LIFFHSVAALNKHADVFDQHETPADYGADLYQRAVSWHIPLTFHQSNEQGSKDEPNYAEMYGKTIAQKDEKVVNPIPEMRCEGER